MHDAKAQSEDKASKEKVESRTTPSPWSTNREADQGSSDKTLRRRKSAVRPTSTSSRKDLERADTEGHEAR
jgi:hypothetical protein